MASKKDAYKEVYDALDASGLEWEAVNGKKHVKLYLAGYLIGILPHGKATSSEANRRNNINIARRIARAIPEIKAGTFNPRDSG